MKIPSDELPSPDLSARIQPFNFDHSDQLAQALAIAVAEQMRLALAARGQASVALSGGTTPLRFLQALSKQSLDWSKIAVTLVDERWVDDRHARSNARLIQENLLQGPAAAARFVPLYRNLPQPEDALAEITASLPHSLDVAVLGMGADGHTASFFPGGDHLQEALDPITSAMVLPMRAAGAGEPRITLTLSALLSVGSLFLHLEGAEKQAVLARARSGQGEGMGYPIRAVLAQLSRPLKTYWCP